mmetsp:Transcript_38677/g.46649  ORF Transcript_38677/g.46649 Transcript_38677/m.46649 type:complete len:94 (-) Transcript_38677:804-1085(-)
MGLSLGTFFSSSIINGVILALKKSSGCFMQSRVVTPQLHQYSESQPICMVMSSGLVGFYLVRKIKQMVILLNKILSGFNGSSFLVLFGFALYG